jgi:hypothetical protein
MPATEPVMPPAKDGACICVGLALKLCSDGGSFEGMTWETVLQTLHATDLLSQSYKPEQVCQRRCRAYTQITNACICHRRECRSRANS